MPKVQRFFTASTRDVADQCIENGLLNYPGICFLKDTKSLLWITENNTIDEIIGNNQITNITFEDGYILFHGVDRILYSVEIKFSDEIAENVKEQIIEEIDLDSYIKTEDAVKLIDTAIGDIGESRDVVDYINKVTYQDMNAFPIQTQIGTVGKPIDVSSLTNGVYRILGQYVIGGDNQTICIGQNSDLFMVERTEDGENIYIKKSSSTSTDLFTITNIGNVEIDKMATQEWVKDFYKNGDIVTVVNEQMDKNLSRLGTEEIDKLF